MHYISAGTVSARIEWLIQTHDGGDRETAGQRLGITPDRLLGLLSGDWRRFSLDDLARLVQGYGVPVETLFSFASSEDPSWPSPRQSHPNHSSSTSRSSPAAS